MHFDDLFLQEKKYLTEVLDKAGNGSELSFFMPLHFDDFFAIGNNSLLEFRRESRRVKILCTDY